MKKDYFERVKSIEEIRKEGVEIYIGYASMNKTRHLIQRKKTEQQRKEYFEFLRRRIKEGLIWKKTENDKRDREKNSQGLFDMD